MWNHAFFIVIIFYMQEIYDEKKFVSDDIISTDPSTCDIVAAYRWTTMSQTKIWDIKVLWEEEIGKKKIVHE